MNVTGNSGRISWMNLFKEFLCEGGHTLVDVNRARLLEASHKVFGTRCFPSSADHELRHVSVTQPEDVVETVAHPLLQIGHGVFWKSKVTEQKQGYPKSRCDRHMRRYLVTIIFIQGLKNKGLEGFLRMNWFPKKIIPQQLHERLQNELKIINK